MDHLPERPSMTLSRRLFWMLLLCGLVGPEAAVTDGAEGTDEVPRAEERIAQSVRILADDSMEGRGIGTAGLDRAAEYIAKEFAKIGLETTIVAEGPFQNFTVTTEAAIGPPERNRLRFVPPSDSEETNRMVDLQLEEDFTPLAAGGSGKFDLPLAFVGYGITDEEIGYDDYADVDVRDKCVIILRHQPLRATSTARSEKILRSMPTSAQKFQTPMPTVRPPLSSAPTGTMSIRRRHKRNRVGSRPSIGFSPPMPTSRRLPNPMQMSKKPIANKSIKRRDRLRFSAVRSRRPRIRCSPSTAQEAEVRTARCRFFTCVATRSIE